MDTVPEITHVFPANVLIAYRQASCIEHHGEVTTIPYNLWEIKQNGYVLLNPAMDVLGGPPSLWDI